MAQKPSTPKGTRDFNPEQVAKRNYIFNTIRNAFDTFGFQPIETPSFENSDTLMGKYGEEGDRLIFKILNSGDFLSDVELSSKNLRIELRRFLKDAFVKLFKEKFLNKTITDFENTTDVENIFIFFEKSFFTNELKKVFSKSTSEKIKKEFKKNQFSFSQILVKYLGKTINNKQKLISNSRYFSRAIDRYTFENIFSKDYYRDVASEISEKALRYDLTVPFARYVVQHQNEIEFPFKRYQIQPVWRADRPQKGRFREFYQCDADVVGSDSLWQEVEFIQLYDTVFSSLKLEGVTIKINNRKILSGIAEVIDASDKLIDFTVALDKLDKIGEEKVKAEMLSKGIPQTGIDKLQPLFSLSGSFKSQIESLNTILSTSEEGKKGIEELAFINTVISELGLKSAKLQLDVTLARGLNYYTGAIFEVAAPEGVKMGSIGGGGRYDDLTGIFGMKNMSGVGISFGLDRIYLVLEELNLFPETVSKNVEVLFINFGEKEALFSLKAIKQLREKGINAELYPDTAKMKKQMTYANRRNIPFVVLVGDKEIAANTYTLKQMVSGTQEEVSFSELIAVIKKP